jgi:hypothetical protein
MSGAIPRLPQYVFLAWCLVKQRDNFTFIFTYTVFKKLALFPRSGVSLNFHHNSLLCYVIQFYAGCFQRLHTRHIFVFIKRLFPFVTLKPCSSWAQDSQSFRFLEEPHCGTPPLTSRRFYRNWKKKGGQTKPLNGLALGVGRVLGEHPSEVCVCVFGSIKGES